MRCAAVLCVDDAEEILSFYRDLLGGYGYEVLVAANGSEALELFRPPTPPIRAAIIDYHMPGMTGLELAASLKRLDPNLPIVMVAGNAPQLDQMSPFVDAAIPKGVPIHQITSHLELLIEERTTRTQPIG